MAQTGDFSQKYNGVATKQYGRANNTISLTAGYTATVEPADALTLKFNASLPVSLNFQNAGYQETNGTKAYVNSLNTYNKTTLVDIDPAFNFGLQWDVKENFAFNMGLGVTMPSLRIFSGTKVDPADGKTTSETTTFYSYYVYGIGCSMGFTWALADTVNLDFNWSNNWTGQALINFFSPQFRLMASVKL